MENNDYLRNKAYKEALKFKNSEIEEEVIYAKLEKQGIPLHFAKEVAMNVIIKRNKYKKHNLFDFKTIGVVMIVMWVLGSIIAYIITANIFVVIALFFVCIPPSILSYLIKKKKNLS